MSRSGLDGTIIELFGWLWSAHSSSILRWDVSAMSMSRWRASHGSWSTVPIAGRAPRRRLAIIIELAHVSRHGSGWPEDSIFVVNDDPSSLARVAGVPAELLAALTAVS